jgi:hypothetical protein
MRREVSEFNKVYLTQTNLVKDKIGDLLADYYNILNGRKHYFSQR